MRHTLGLSKFIFVTVVLAFSFPNRAIAQKAFCEKDWPLQGADKIAFEKFTTGETAGFTVEWPTRTIPYYVDHELPQWVIDKIKLAARILRAKTSLKLVKCNRNIAAAPGVQGFLYIGKLWNFCEKAEGEAIGCSKGVGMKKVQLPNGLPKEQGGIGAQVGGGIGAQVGSGIDATSEDSMKNTGSPIGLDFKNIDRETKQYSLNEYIIIHELIHRLGFMHQQQNPSANNKQIFNNNNWSDPSTCGPVSAPWLSGIYDPASIMHYSLSACGGIDLKCTPGGLT